MGILFKILLYQSYYILWALILLTWCKATLFSLFLCCLSTHFSSYFYKSILDGDEDVPSALAQAIPSFVKLGVILPEGVDAEALSKAAREAEAATSAAGRNLSKYGISKQSMASKSQKKKNTIFHIR